MRRLLSVFMLAAAMVAMPAISADTPVKKATSKPVASNAMDPAKGSFHRVHTKKLKLSCETCHSTEPKDVLFLRGAEVVASGAQPVDRAACQGCHQTPQKPAWYGAAR